MRTEFVYIVLIFSMLSTRGGGNSTSLNSDFIDSDYQFNDNLISSPTEDVFLYSLCKKTIPHNYLFTKDAVSADLYYNSDGYAMSLYTSTSERRKKPNHLKIYSYENQNIYSDISDDDVMSVFVRTALGRS